MSKLCDGCGCPRHYGRACSECRAAFYECRRGALLSPADSPVSVPPNPRDFAHRLRPGRIYTHAGWMEESGFGAAMVRWLEEEIKRHEKEVATEEPFTCEGGSDGAY